MGIWKMSQLKAPPQTDDPAELREYIKYMSNQIASMLKDLDFTLNGDVDFRNVRAKSITADRMDVNELSAITANLGHITAGLIESVEIYGSYIATRRNAYPRAEISNMEDLFAVYSNANNHIKILPGVSNTPNINFTEVGSIAGTIGPNLGIFIMHSASPMTVSSSQNLALRCGTGLFDRVSVPSWSRFSSVDTGRTLQQELNDIWNAISGLSSSLSGKSNVGHTHTVDVDGTTYTTSS